jgi:hypothetical protein
MDLSDPPAAFKIHTLDVPAEERRAVNRNLSQSVTEGKAYLLILFPSLQINRGVQMTPKRSIR